MPRILIHFILGGFDQTFDERMLWNAFITFGDIVDVVIPKDMTACTGLYITWQ